MSDWNDFKLADLAASFNGAFATGPFGSAVSARHFRKEGFPMIRGSNLSTDLGTRLDDRNIIFLDPSIAERFPRCVARRGDLIFTCWGTIGQVGFIDHRAQYSEYLVSNKQMKFTPDPEKADARFLYYLLAEPESVASLSKAAIGSSVPGFNLGQLKAWRVTLPPLDEQRRIAEVLGALDDLIDTNERLASKLWAAAELSFTRCQIESGSRVALGSLIELKYGKALPAEVRRPGHVPVVSSAGISGSHDTALVEGPGVVVGRKGSVGSVTWVDSDFFPIDTAFYVKTLEVSLLWAYFLLKSLPLESMNTDSAVPGLNRSNALALEVARPTESVLSEFNRQALALIESAGRIHEEIDQLRHTRDELLPLMMSGAVRVRPEGVSA